MDTNDTKGEGLGVGVISFFFWSFLGVIRKVRVTMEDLIVLHLNKEEKKLKSTN